MSRAQVGGVLAKMVDRWRPCCVPGGGPCRCSAAGPCGVCIYTEDKQRDEWTMGVVVTASGQRFRIDMTR